MYELYHKVHLPLKGFFSKPISFPKSTEKDRIFAGGVFTSNIHLLKSQNV